MLKEQHPFWSAWSRAIIRYPRSIITIAVVTTAILGVVAWRTPKDLSFTGILDDSDQEMHHFRETVSRFALDSMLLILIEGKPQEVDRSVALLEKELLAQPAVRSVTPPADPDWLITRAPWIWPRNLFDSAIAAAHQEKVPDAVLRAIDTTDAGIRRLLRPVPEAALVGIGLHKNPLDLAMGGRDYYAIERATYAILDRNECDVTVAFTGLMAAAAQDQKFVMNRIKILTPLTLLLVLILLMGVERRLSRVLLAGLALSFSVIISFGLTGITLGHLSITVTFFGMLLLGLGIDFGIHLLVSLRDARSQGKSPEDCLRFGLRHTATAIALGGISTALAFGLVALAPDPGARHMGFAALYGLLAALLLMLTFLPAAWLILERRHENQDTPARFRLPGLHRTVAFSLQHPRAVLLLTAAICAWGIAGLPRYSLERDLEKIISRRVTAFGVDDRLEELFGVSPVSYLAPVESLDQARQWKQKLLQLEDIAGATSAADIILPDAPERLSILNALLQNPPKTSNPILLRLDAAYRAGPIELDAIPPSLANGMVNKNGDLALTIIPKKHTLDADILTDQIDRVRAIAPTATGVAIIIRMAAMGTRDYIPILIPGILIAVTLILILALRNLRDVLLALLPVLVGTTLSFGIFCWFGLQMSILTAAVVPVILGLGVDDGIHVIDRLRQYHGRNAEIIQEAVEGVGRAIFLTTATTCVSFITLLFTDHAGLEGIAWFMLIGIPICFIASITVLPAAALLLSDSHPDNTSPQDQQS